MKHLLFLFFFVAGTYSLHAQNDRFPLVANSNCNNIDGKPWRSCGLATLYSTGKFLCSVKTESANPQGFSGAVLFTFYSEDGKPVLTIETPAYTVKGKASTLVPFSEMLDKKLVQHIFRFEAKGIRSSNTKTIKKLLPEGEKLMKAAATAKK
ncbi:MAG TPA: hypothetical protein PKL94_08325 [Saprospiraceae bacterium]|nr:hypothetical protein [Saprospiraceae bacterium]HMX85641.1 hypothetical protein [Saprospiraceae bacterium]HNE66266.1 hypothetical protein [Saprospiraceae bacterium]HNL29953.1 hypothetical protein [Saprospiraceae bacterium]